MNIVRPDLLPYTLPLPLVILFALGAVGLWLFLHWKGGRRSAPTPLLVIAAFPVAVVACWLVLQSVGRVIYLGTPWSVWGSAFIAGILLQGTALLYRHEASLVTPRRARLLLFLRLAAILITLFILLQPVLMRERTRSIHRQVIVLVDDSASMYREDIKGSKVEGGKVEAEDASDNANVEVAELVEASEGDNSTALQPSTFDLQPTNMSRAASARLMLECETNTISQLREKYTLTQRTFGSPDATDITHALEEVLRDIPSEELAGVLLLSDGRHTGPSGVEPVSRRYSQINAPIGSILFGNTDPIPDIAIASLQVNENIFLGDSVRASVTLIATEARGKETTVRLLCDGEILAEEHIAIDTDDFTRELRLVDTPVTNGVRSYVVTAETFEGEAVTENNEWAFDVSVSDDRTNVLLVDRQPRWEYRYLRNLFFGRDKSVHLQYLLTEPDTILDYPATNRPPASAGREFGDAEAGSLPESRDEWRKFDVIILGDVGSETLTPDILDHIRYCVEERGAMLVVIAGTKGDFPQGLRALLPVTFGNEERSKVEGGKVEASKVEGRRLEGRSETSTDNVSLRPSTFQPSTSPFRLALTPAGRAGDIMRLSASVSENELLWKNLPDLQWRMTVDDVKPGSEILAYAEPLFQAAAPARTAASDPVAELEALRKRQAKNALIVARPQGRGKVLFLSFDRTWRLRYRVGDTLHHRFWGNVMRWGIGEKLRSGNAAVRLGTDRLSYLPGENVQIMARLMDAASASINDATIDAILSKDGKNINRVRLAYRPDSNGFYEGTLPALVPGGKDDPLGRYVITLTCDDARIQNTEQRTQNAERATPSSPSSPPHATPHDGSLPTTTFLVVSARTPAETIHPTADPLLLRRIAELSDGIAHASTNDLSGFIDLYGEGSRTVTENVEFALWDSWAYFLALLILLTAEWLVRKYNSLP